MRALTVVIVTQPGEATALGHLLAAHDARELRVESWADYVRAEIPIGRVAAVSTLAAIETIAIVTTCQSRAVKYDDGISKASRSGFPMAASMLGSS